MPCSIDAAQTHFCIIVSLLLWYILQTFPFGSLVMFNMEWIEHFMSAHSIAEIPIAHCLVMGDNEEIQGVEYPCAMCSYYKATTQRSLNRHTPSSCVATLQASRAAAKSSKDRTENQIYKVQCWHVKMHFFKTNAKCKLFKPFTENDVK